MGRRLRALLKKRGVTLAQLADAIGKGESTVHHYISGRSAPDPETARSIADFFKVSVDDLDVRSRKIRGAAGVQAIDIERIQKQMETLHLTPAGLAQAAGLSRQSVHSYLTSQTRPGAARLKRMASALELEPDQLVIPDEGAEAPAPAAKKAKPSARRAKSR